LLSNYISDKKEFTYVDVKATVLATMQPFETPDFNYYNLLPHAYLPHTPAIAVADVNKDGVEDIYVGGVAGEEKYILAGSKDGKFTKVAVDAFAAFKDRSDTEAQWVDVNNDGLPDLIVLSASHPFLEAEKIVQPRLYINKGNYKFEYKALPVLNALVSKILVYDFDGDGLKTCFLAAA
jgi:hypothetical protein